MTKTHDAIGNLNARRFRWGRAKWAATSGVVAFALLLSFVSAARGVIEAPSVYTFVMLAAFPINAMGVILLGTVMLIVPTAWCLGTLWGFVQWRLLVRIGALHSAASAVVGTIPGATLSVPPIWLLASGSAGQKDVAVVFAICGAVAGAIAGAVLVSKRLD